MRCLPKGRSDNLGIDKETIVSRFCHSKVRPTGRQEWSTITVHDGMMGMSKPRSTREISLRLCDAFAAKVCTWADFESTSTQGQGRARLTQIEHVFLPFFTPGPGMTAILAPATDTSKASDGDSGHMELLPSSPSPDGSWRLSFAAFAEKLVEPPAGRDRRSKRLRKFYEEQNRTIESLEQAEELIELRLGDSETADRAAARRAEKERKVGPLVKLAWVWGWHGEGLRAVPYRLFEFRLGSISCPTHRIRR